MELQAVAVQIAVVLALVGFGSWLSYLSWKIETSLRIVENSEERLDEIKDSVELVATILNRLPELMPQFSMNTNPLQPIFEAFAQKLSGTQSLMTLDPARGPDGRFNDGTTTQSETQNTNTKG
jgi:hypothetical protein